MERESLRFEISVERSSRIFFPPVRSKIRKRLQWYSEWYSDTVIQCMLHSRGLEIFGFVEFLKSLNRFVTNYEVLKYADCSFVYNFYWPRPTPFVCFPACKQTIQTFLTTTRFWITKMWNMHKNCVKFNRNLMLNRKLNEFLTWQNELIWAKSNSAKWVVMQACQPYWPSLPL